VALRTRFIAKRTAPSPIGVNADGTPPFWLIHFSFLCRAKSPPF
jgi:hypothetical protein